MRPRTDDPVSSRRRRRAAPLAAALAAVLSLTAWGFAAAAPAVSAPGRDAAARTGAAASKPLTVTGSVSLSLPSHDVLTAAEAPDGTVFYAPRPVFGEKGRITHGKAAAEVVRVVHGTSRPAAAEHTGDPVLALAAGRTRLVVVTTTHAVVYDRSSGAVLRSWALPTRSTYATVALTSRWLYVSSAFECDYCGYEDSTLRALDLRSSATHTVTRKAVPGAVAARGSSVYYAQISGHVVRTTATAPTDHHAAVGPDTGTSILGLFGHRLVVWGVGSDGGHAAVWLLQRHSLSLTSSHRIGSADAYDVVETANGPVMSTSTCPVQLAASECHSSDAGTLGHRVSRVLLSSGRRSDSVSVPHVDFLVGPDPVAVTVSSGHYRLVRIG